MKCCESNICSLARHQQVRDVDEHEVEDVMQQAER
jgi:hypothetical protein